jgi:hypothetical protein
MRSSHTLTALLLALAAANPSFAADKHAHEHEHEPLHGGQVVEVQDVDYELVAKPELLQLYLRDHGKPMDPSGASARLTLLSGSEKQEVELRPAGDRLEAAGSFTVSAGTKVVAIVRMPGNRTGTVRYVLK